MIRLLQAPFLKLYSENELRKQVGRNARAYVEKHFSWEVQAEQLADVLTNVRRSDQSAEHTSVVNRTDKSG